MAAVAVNQTAIDTAMLGTDGRAKIDMSSRLWKLESEAAPLCSLLMNPKLKSSPAKAVRVDWLSSGLLPRLTTAAEALDDSETGVTVATGTGAYFRKGDVVLNTFTGERMLTVSVSGDVLTVKRGLGTATYGTTGIASVGSVDELARLANAQMQGSTNPEVRMVSYAGAFNYTQISRTAGEFTRTATEVDIYGPGEPAEEIRNKGVEHKAEWEASLFFGARQIDTSGAHPLTTMGGLSFYITTHVTASVGTLTEAIWETFLAPLGRYGGGEKVIFCSPLVARALSSFVKAKIVIDNSGENVKTYGLALNKWLSGAGDGYTLIVKKDWADFSTVSGSPGGSAFVVDMANIELAPLHKTEFKAHIEAPDADSVKFEYLTEQSVRIGNESTMGIITGITGF